jgi:hypothetical protein
LKSLIATFFVIFSFFSSSQLLCLLLFCLLHCSPLGLTPRPCSS